MSTEIEGLLYSWNKNLAYGQKLAIDIPDEKMTYQPAPNMNHPAWILSHLNLYLPIVIALIKNESFTDPKEHRFGMQSKPEADITIYDSKENLIQNYVQGHEEVAKVLRSAGSSVLELPVTLPRWKNIMPRVGIALPYIMLVHENTHLGQWSAWRRVQNLKAV